MESGLAPPGESQSVIIHLFDSNMVVVFQVATRRDIRERYGIRGTESSDFCTPFCCQSCDLVQGSRELQLEEESFDAPLHYGST